MLTARGWLALIFLLLMPISPLWAGTGEPVAKDLVASVVILPSAAAARAEAAQAEKVVHQDREEHSEEELEDVMKRMGKTVKALRKLSRESSAAEEVRALATRLRQYIEMASRKPPEDPTDASYFQEGMVELIAAADRLADASENGGNVEVEAAVRDLLSVRKKYHKLLGV